MIIKSKPSIIVVGSGFKGLMASLNLVEKGYRVTVVDVSKNIGGILNSPKWDKLTIDLGCHLFSNFKDANTKIITSILEENFSPVDVKYASFFNKKKTEDLAIPNFEDINAKEKVKLHFDFLAKKKLKKVVSLEDFYQNRFGKASLKYIDKCLKKSHLTECHKLDSFSNKLLYFNRIRIFSENKALKLKTNPFYDDRIAIPKKLIFPTSSIYNFREYYPNNEGLSFFCNQLQQLLISKGVVFKLNTSIEKIQYSKGFNLHSKANNISGDNLYWAAPQNILSQVFLQSDRLDKFIHKTPLILFYFIVKRSKVSDYTYVQNFDSAISSFRISIQSNYADNNVPQELALICCEVPVRLESKIWKESHQYIDTIWEELISLNIVMQGKFIKSKILKTSSAYRLPLLGYSNKFKKIKAEIDHPNLFGLSDWDYSKNEIMNQINIELNDI